MATTLNEFIDRKVVVLRVDDSLYQASRAMCDNNIGCVVVSDNNGSVIAILTDRDLACIIPCFDNASDVTLDEVVEPGLIWATEDDSLEGVIELMQEHSIRRVPIVTHTSRGLIKCVGFVTLDDLICKRVISIEEAAKIIEPQVQPRLHKSDEQRSLRRQQRPYKGLSDALL